MSKRVKLPRVDDWVHVYWEDACHYAGWMPSGGYNYGLKPTESVGVVIHANRKQVCIAQCISHQDSGRRDFGDVEVIPTPCITRIKKVG